MANEFRCTQCGRLLQTGDTKPGTRMLCPGCGAFSTVPVPNTGSSIEFRCTRCQKLLRTPGDTAGKQAKCPECGAVLAVPTPEVGSPGPPPPGTGERSPFGAVPPPPPPDVGAGSPFAPGGPPPAAGFDPENPYAAPSEYAAAPAHAPEARAGFAATIIDFGDIFGRTWEIFKKEWGMCLVVMIVAFLINVVFNIVVSVGSNIVAVMAGEEIIALVLTLMGYVVTTLFSVWIGIGQALYFLKVTRGQRAELGDIFTGGPYFLPVIGASILYGLITFLGYLLCIIPGIIFGLMCSQFYYLILDRNVGVMDSLSISKELTTGNKLTLFLIGLVGGLAAIVIVLCTCGLGLFAVAPFFGLLSPVIYLAMTGQPTADQLRPRLPAA